MKKILYLLFFLPLIINGQTNSENWIKNTIYKIPVTSNPQTVSDADKLVTVTYFDGLGRPKQKIGYKQSGNGRDLVTPVVYDEFQRQPKDYLPYESTASDMLFIDNNVLIPGLESQYLTKYGTAEGQHPYSEKSLEFSPLGRVLEQGAPGTDWLVNTSSDTDHTIKYEYLLNTDTPAAEKIKLFKAVATWNATNEVYTTTLSNATGTVFYAANQLYKIVIKDENWVSGKGNTVEEYKNQQGQLILKRNFNGATPVAYDTYYVYDQYGNLTFVIPPLASGTSVTSTVLNGLCYQYRYDRRNLKVEKKLPGKQWEYIVYDQLDRVVATGPVYSPFGAGSQGWIFTKYDDLNRIALSGWYVASSFTSTTRKTLQASNNGAIINAQRGTSTVDAVAINYAPLTLPSGFKLLTVNYYDDYAFLPAALTPLPSAVESKNIITSTTAVTTKGLSTGSWNRALQATTSGELAYNLYDENSRQLRSYTQNYLGGYTYTDSKLKFTGLTDYTITRHKRIATGTELYVKNTFTYTALQQPLFNTHQITTTGTPQLLSKSEYDEYGLLKTKKVGGTDITAATYFQKIDYGYNIRGWLKSINNISSLTESGQPQDMFAFKINYNEIAGNVSGVKKLYNGNISETYWRSASDNVQRKYGYVYDNLNRLQNSVYQKPGNSVEVTNSYNETITYDKNGNITSMARTGGMDADNSPINIDNLVYEYAGSSNQLMKVYDTSNSTQGFSDDSDGTNDTNNDYAYDLNGNVLSDENKKIRGITYNHLNQPVNISFDITGTNTIDYIYDASGQKLQKKVTMTVNGTTTTTTTDYLTGGFQYADTVLQFFPTSEGYIRIKDDKYNYVYNYTDHLGNVRVSYALDPANPLQLKTIEENHYYPFGLKHENYNISKFEYLPVPGGIILASVSALMYKYKYNGKELQDELGLNLYDYGFRNYDPALGRWLAIDAHSESYSQISPYNYVKNNPINLIDLLGLDPVYKNGKYYDNGKEVTWDYVQSWIQGNDGVAASYTFKTDEKGNAKLTGTKEKGNKGNDFMFNGKKYTANSYMTLMGRDDGNNNVGDFKNIENLEMGYIYQILGQAAYVIFDLYHNSVEGAALNESGTRGLLDYKNIMFDMFGFNRRSLIQINGIVYNPNEAGNFLWGMVLEYYGSVLSPNMGAEVKTRVGTNGLNGRPDERWEQKAITAGRKFGLQLYQNKTPKSEDLILTHRLSNRE